jgi:hypothetical protein
MPIAAFILAGCFIDMISRIRFFKWGLNDAERFQKLIYDYFPHQYKNHEKKLYVYLRSTLIHNYSVKGQFYLDWGNGDSHLKVAPDNRIFLNIHKFIEDLAFAHNIYEQQMMGDVPDVRENALAHNKKFLILQDRGL